MDRFTITKNWLNQFSTVRTEWTPEQLAVLEVPRNREKGWFNALIGSQITLDQKEAFEALHRTLPNRKVIYQQSVRLIQLLDESQLLALKKRIEFMLDKRSNDEL